MFNNQFIIIILILQIIVSLLLLLIRFSTHRNYSSLSHYIEHLHITRYFHCY